MERAAIWACKRENYQQYVLYIFIAKIYHYGERFNVNGHDQLILSSQLFAQGRRLILPFHWMHGLKVAPPKVACAAWRG
jgi:hypothetical protein